MLVSAMRFFKNASRAEVVQGWKNKSHVQSWKGAPPKKDPLTFVVLVPETKNWLFVCLQ